MSKPKILVVDDTQMIREMLVNYLTEQGWEVTTAENGVDGFRLWCCGHYDVVSTDFEMPGMNGLELTKKILQANSKAIVYMFSGTPLAKALVLGLGAQGFYDKLDPITYMDVLEKAKEAL